MTATEHPVGGAHLSDTLTQAGSGTRDSAQRAAPTCQPALEAAIGSTYAIKRRLGAGGMGEVFLAVEVAAQRQVVLKALRGAAAEEANRNLLKDEAVKIGQVLHPNVVALYVARMDCAPPFLVMEYVDGLTLAEWQRAGTRTLAERLDVYAQVLRGVGAAHRKGIVHCDLKPQNVLVRTDEGAACAKVVDFGLGRVLGDRSLRLEAGDPRGGTVPYMAPEQFPPVGEVSERTDIYALGALLFELLSGQPPFVEASHEEYRRAHLLRAVPPLPPRATEGVDLRKLDAVIARAMAKHPFDRYPSCEALASAVAEALPVPSAAAASPTGPGAPGTGRRLLQSSPATGRPAFLVFVEASVHVGTDEAPASLDDAHTIRQAASEVLTPVAEAFEVTPIAREPAGTMLWAIGLRRAQRRAPMRAMRLTAELLRVFDLWLEEVGDPSLPPIRLSVTVHAGDVLVTDGPTGAVPRVAGPVLDQTRLLTAVAPPGSIVLTEPVREGLDTFSGISPFASPLTGLRTFLVNPDSVAAGARTIFTDLGQVDAPLVGRDDELDLLDVRCRRALRDRRAALVWIVGESGIGKTRVAQELVRRAREDHPELSCVTTVCSDGRDQPFDTVSHLLRDWFALDLGLPVEAQRADLREQLLRLFEKPATAADLTDTLLPAIAPGAQRSVGLIELQRDSPERARPLLDAIISVITARTSLTKGLLWVIDGAEHMDASTGDLLQRLASLPAPVIVVGTTSETAESTREPWRAALLQSGQTIALRALRPADIDTLFERHPDDRIRALRTQSEAIWEMAAGNPLLVVEVAHQLARRSLVWTESTRAAFDMMDGLAGGVRLRAWLEFRLHGLEQGQRLVLEACATLDPPFPLDAVAAVCDTTPEEIGPSVAELIKGGWLRMDHYACAKPASCPHLRVAIPLASPLLRASLFASRRRHLHARWAEFCERNRGRLDVSAARLAWHHQEAGAHGRALGLWLEAASQARRLSGPQAAVEHVAHAEACLARLGQPALQPPVSKDEIAARRLEVSLESLLGSYLLGDNPQLIERADTLLIGVSPELAVHETAVAVKAASIALLAAMAACKLGNLTDALQRCDDALSWLATRRSPTVRETEANILHVRAWILYLRCCPGDSEAAVEPLLRALELLGNETPMVATGAARRLLSILEMRRGRLTAAKSHADKSLHIFRLLDMPREQGMALINLGSILAMTSEVSLARAAYGEAREIFDAVGAVESVSVCDHNLGDLAFQEGDLPGSLVHLRAARRAFEEQGSRWCLPDSLYSLAQAHLERGEWEECWEAAEAALDCAHECEMHVHSSLARALLAARTALGGRPEEADRQLADATRALEQADAPGLSAYARATFGLALARGGEGPVRERGAACLTEGATALSATGPRALQVVAERWALEVGRDAPPDA